MKEDRPIDPWVHSVRVGQSNYAELFREKIRLMNELRDQEQESRMTMKRFDGVQILVFFFGGCGVGFALAAIFLP